MDPVPQTLSNAIKQFSSMSFSWAKTVVQTKWFTVTWKNDYFTKKESVNNKSKTLFSGHPIKLTSKGV